jgi:hypothetical protein
MPTPTPTPAGNLLSQEELYIEGAPNIYIQDYRANPTNNPDTNGYFWGLTGTATYPVYGLACVTDVSFGQGITANDIRCDTDGIKGHVQRRDYVEFSFTLQTLMPLATYAKIANFSTATVTNGMEQIGIGEIDNNRYWMVYAPRVYDPASNSFLLIHLHKAQFVEPGEIQFKYGDPWTQSFKVRGFADSTKPSNQRFGVIVRSDAAIVSP